MRSHSTAPTVTGGTGIGGACTTPPEPSRWASGALSKEDLRRSGAARAEGLAGAIEFREGDAQALPIDDEAYDVSFSSTVMEEIDADCMMAELVRLNGGSPSMSAMNQTPSGLVAARTAAETWSGLAMPCACSATPPLVEVEAEAGAECLLDARRQAWVRHVCRRDRGP